MSTVSAFAPDGIPEVVAGTDLAALVAGATELLDGDVVVVTSKVVSKSEGRVRDGHRADHLAAETARVVARRGPMAIVRTRHGLTLAAAGIDDSNVEVGRSVLLPLDPDDSARRLRSALAARTGRTLAVIVTDTAGRPWREGQTDIAIGAAGLVVAESYAGRHDAHGNELAVTAPAVADEMAGLAELAQSKLGGRPFAVVRGRPDLVLPPDEHGPGAAALIRADHSDLFGYGAREAVVRAVTAQPEDQAPFGAAVPADELVEVLRAAGRAAEVIAADLVACPGDRHDVTAVLAFAHGWGIDPDESAGRLRLRPTTP